MNSTPETPAERIRAWWTARPAPAIRPEDECFDLTLNRPILRVLDIPALLAERDQLCAQVAALKVALREDVELVAEVCNDYGNDEGPREIRRLYAQFEARIEAAVR